MIHESQVPDLLGKQIPAINPELEKLAGLGNVYKTVQCFADFTRNLAGAGNLPAVKSCIGIAEEMLEKGNNTVKNAIENVFLYTLSPILDMGDEIGIKLKAMMKGALLKEYNRQTNHGGI